MKQEFQSSPIQHLMIFLRETPPDGIQGFERQVLHHATYITEGSSDKHFLIDRISDDTKIKLLVTGEIELNEKNVFIGLKMAFPEWDFQSYPLNIQRLFLKGPTWTDAKEVGVIATTDLTRHSEGNHWGVPFVLNLSTDQEDQYLTTGIRKDIPSLSESIPSSRLSDAEAIDFSDEFFEKKNDKGTAQPTHDEIDFASILDLAKDLSSEDLDEEASLDSQDQLELHQEPRIWKGSKSEDYISGVESNELLKEFGKETRGSRFTRQDEDETFDFGFLDGASTFSPSLDDTDTEEYLFSQERYDSRTFADDEDEFISPTLLEPDVGFELEGFVEENYDGEEPSVRESINDKEQVLPWLQPFQDILNKLQSLILNRIQKLPIQKIFLASLISGIAIISLSYGVKVFEPNYEAIRKAAGVVDLYEWIIMNDLVESDTETNSIINQWKESSEYDQFWLWFDTQWNPRITRYQKIENGLRKIGSLFISPAVIILMIALVGRAVPFIKKRSQNKELEPTNRISLNFTSYTPDWSLVDAWAKETGFKILEVEDTRRLYRKKGTFIHPPILCLLSIQGDQVQMEVWVSTRIPTILIPLFSDLGLEVLEAKKGVLPASIKALVNKLLLKLGHPPMA